jgi:uncharacterized protein YecT (DUF1311 family)
MRMWVMLALLLISPAEADDAPNCAEPQTQSEMTICANKAYEKANADMVALFTTMVAESDQVRASLWKESQEAWLKHRDAMCALYGDLARGGTMAGSLYWNCMSDLAKERTGDLQRVRSYFER